MKQVLRTIQVSAPDRVLEGEDIEVTLTNTEGGRYW